jgi:hypothetical protein
MSHELIVIKYLLPPTTDNDKGGWHNFSIFAPCYRRYGVLLAKFTAPLPSFPPKMFFSP